MKPNTFLSDVVQIYSVYELDDMTCLVRNETHIWTQAFWLCSFTSFHYKVHLSKRPQCLTLLQTGTAFIVFASEQSQLIDPGMDLNPVITSLHCIQFYFYYTT